MAWRLSRRVSSVPHSLAAYGSMTAGLPRRPLAHHSGQYDAVLASIPGRDPASSTRAQIPLAANCAREGPTSCRSTSSWCRGTGGFAPHHPFFFLSPLPRLQETSHTLPRSSASLSPPKDPSNLDSRPQEASLPFPLPFRVPCSPFPRLSPLSPPTQKMLLSRSARVSDSSAADVPGRGAFIVFEGLDRSGKSTQCSRALKVLEQQGLPVQSMRFPDRSTPIGQEINAYLASTKDIDTKTIHQLFSQNRWEKKDAMEKLLLSGTSLLVDRYAFSGVAYSAAKGLDLGWCKIADAGLPAPDLVIYLDVNPEAASKRGDYGLERYEKLEFQMLVAKHYADLRDSSWKVVDASEPLDDVTKKVEVLVNETVERCRNSKSPPIRALWSSSETQAFSALEQSLRS